MELLKDVLFVFLFFGPAGLANVAAFASGKIRFLKPYNYPVDGGLKYHKKRILGSHKTVRGFIAAIIVGILSCCLTVFLYTNFNLFREIMQINYEEINPVILGSLLGFGALAGDAVKSFFKRQMNVPPGKSWVPFDQVDYIVGGILFSALYVQLSLWHYFLIFVLYVLLHPLGNFLGYLFKLRKEPL